jgi:uncharacterized membrane protein YgdD (TMEM256/DUF423 family)
VGAFGAHYLKSKLSVEQLQTFEVGVRYQMYHALAMLALAILSERNTSKYHNYTYWCFLIGILLFSGSIYLLSTKTLFGLESFSKVLGPVTPLGGLLLISGWLFIFIAGFGSKSPKTS